MVQWSSGLGLVFFLFQVTLDLQTVSILCLAYRDRGYPAGLCRFLSFTESLQRVHRLRLKSFLEGS